MPPGLESDWSLRGYYGTLSQDAQRGLSALCRLV